jgi:RNA polymerase sigma-70 factor (ECF subfamily)
MEFIGQSLSLSLKPTEVTRAELLVLAVQAGSHTAFEELQALYSRRLYRTILSITKNREDAEDALQETLLRAYLGVANFEGRSSVYSWLTRIAINSALMVLRKRRARPDLNFEPFNKDQDVTPAHEIRDYGPDPEQAFLQRQRQSRLLSAIQHLDPKLRLPIEIQLSSDCTMKELAGMLDISLAATKARLYRARRRIGASHEFKRMNGRVHFYAARGSDTRLSHVGVQGLPV